LAAVPEALTICILSPTGSSSMSTPTTAALLKRVLDALHTL
jgi:hypothetical protein